MTATSPAERLADRLSRATLIHDPIVGSADPATVKTGSRLWPGPDWIRIEPGEVTESQGRRIEEYRYVHADGTTLPVVAIFEHDQVRLYSAHALVETRAPILATDETVEHTPGGDDFLAHYFHALETADIETALAAFEPDGYMQHSNGERFQGPERLRQDYEAMFKSNGGTIKVALANVTDDGRHRAFECRMPSGRPAIAIYERGPTNRIQAIRISL